MKNGRIEIKKLNLDICPDFTFDISGHIRIEGYGHGTCNLSGLEFTVQENQEFAGLGSKIDVPYEYSRRIARDFWPNVEALRYFGNFVLSIPMTYIMNVSMKRCIEEKYYIPSEVVLNFQPSHEQETFSFRNQNYEITNLQDNNCMVTCIMDRNSKQSDRFHVFWQDILVYAFDACRNQIDRIPTFIKMSGLNIHHPRVFQWNSNIYILHPIAGKKDVLLVYSPYEEHVDELSVLIPSVMQSIISTFNSITIVNESDHHTK